MVNHDQYIALASSWTRANLLRSCRAGGITAHTIKANKELAELLWLNFGQYAYAEEQKAKSFETDK